jgi:hypothetical protein
LFKNLAGVNIDETIYSTLENDGSGIFREPRAGAYHKHEKAGETQQEVHVGEMRINAVNGKGEDHNNIRWGGSSDLDVRREMWYIPLGYQSILMPSFFSCGLEDALLSSTDIPGMSDFLATDLALFFGPPSSELFDTSVEASIDWSMAMPEGRFRRSHENWVRISRMFLIRAGAFNLHVPPSMMRIPKRTRATWI